MRQRASIAELERDGHNTALLTQLEEMRRRHVGERERLLQELAKPD